MHQFLILILKAKNNKRIEIYYLSRGHSQRLSLGTSFSACSIWNPHPKVK